MRRQLYNVAAETPSSAATFLASLALCGQLVRTPQLAHNVLRGMPLPTNHTIQRPFSPDIGPQDSRTLPVSISGNTPLPAAYDAHPERFVSKPPEPPKLPSGSWINKPDDTDEATQ